MEARKSSSHRSETNKAKHLSTFDCLSTHAPISDGTAFWDRFHALATSTSPGTGCQGEYSRKANIPDSDGLRLAVSFAGGNLKDERFISKSYAMRPSLIGERASMAKGNSC